MASNRTELSDLEHMRAVNHPARWRVLQELWKGETLTATAAAELVGLTPSAMSYHLNQLARLGLIERDTSVDGRERPWRALSDGVTMTGQPDAELGGAMMHNLLASVGRLLTSPPPAEPDSPHWPAGFSYTTLRLTPEQAKDLHQRIDRIIAEFEDRAANNLPEAGGTSADYDVFWIQGVTTPDRSTEDDREGQQRLSTSSIHGG